MLILTITLWLQKNILPLESILLKCLNVNGTACLQFTLTHFRNINQTDKVYKMFTFGQPR